jgi:fructose/tagatose bisphosphate aldolase
MSLEKFNDLMEAAQRGQYAVGYFESWDLESLQAVADAAEKMRSPVLLGFSGVYLHHPERLTREHLGDYAALGNEVCRRISVPACLVYNESPHFDRVMEAIDRNFGMVMYSAEDDRLVERVRGVVERAHARGVAVEAEMAPLQGVAGELASAPEVIPVTNLLHARAFVEQTGIDALAVNVGQAHLHGREEVALNLSVLSELGKLVQVPMVLHGATSVRRTDLQAAIQLGIRKINFGSILKRTYFEALRSGMAGTSERYNPYEVVGSGLKNDVLIQARLALQKVVEDFMVLLGSAGNA